MTCLYGKLCFEDPGEGRTTSYTLELLLILLALPCLFIANICSFQFSCLQAAIFEPGTLSFHSFQGLDVKNKFGRAEDDQRGHAVLVSEGRQLN